MSATEIADTFSLTISSKFNYPDVAAFVLALRDRLGLQHFIETGAFLGATARWASQHFAHVTTIEINPTFHAMAASKMPTNVNCLLGDSRVLLPQTHRQAAGLGKKAVLLGMGSKFELWSEQAHAAQVQSTIGEDEVSEAMLELRL